MEAAQQRRKAEFLKTSEESPLSVRVPLDGVKLSSVQEEEVLDGDSPRIFESFASSRAELAIGRRTLSGPWIDALRGGPERLRGTFEGEVKWSGEAHGEALTRLVEFCSSFVVGEALDGLLAELQEMMRLTAAVAETERLKLFFGRVDTDRCRKFHVDFLRLRAMATYVGPGTEWIRERDVNRWVLDAPPLCPNEANRAILRPGGQVEHARTGDILLLKGARWGDGVQGIVHRSPPIEAAGLSRIVCIVSALG